MKTVKQQVSVEFKVAEFEDKLVILPIMDQLWRDMMYLAKMYLDYEATELRENQDAANKTMQHITTIFRQYQVLSDFGFRSSMPLVLPSEVTKRIKESGL